ncbi:MAG: hypothetical protein IKQ35_00365 [Bacilli bacterium]|nr:hypothetical protein [Bacilli bacterium]
MINVINDRKIRFVIAFGLLCLLIGMIQSSYAKYVSSASATGKFTIAEWTFKVNNIDVVSGSNFSNTLVPTYDTNTNISSGVIAPTSTGYFDLVIDSTKVDVSYNQTITVSTGDDNTITDLKITGYKINNSETILFTGENNTITTTHNLSDTNKTNTYRIYIEWVDGTGESMNNAADTAAASNGVASVKVGLNFTQKAN